MTRTDIINYLIRQRNYKSYLEIGLDNPMLNYVRVECESKESVDPYDPDIRVCTAWREAILNEYLPYLTYRMTSDEFFATYPDKKYDLIFIDGLHVEQQADKDIRNALRRLNFGGAVVIHDCLPNSEACQSPGGDADGSWVGTVWKSVVKYTRYTSCDIKVLDTDWGVGVIEYTERTDFRIPEKLDIEYADFDSRRHSLLHICEPDLEVLFGDRSYHTPLP